MRRRKRRRKQSQTQQPSERIPKPKRNQFVIPYSDRWLGNRWAVKKEGSNRATATFPTQEAAIEYGRDLAITQRCELVIHDRKGNERERRNYNHPRYAALRHEQLMEKYASYRASLESSTPASENAANN